MSKPKCKRAVLNTTGTDKVGYIHRVAEFLAQRSANVEATSCCKVGSQFVTHTLFTASANEMEIIVQTVIAELGDLYPQVIPMELGSDQEARTDQEVRCTLSLLANEDRPGILRKLTELLADKQIDINSLAAASYPTPFQGTTNLFMAEMQIRVPHRSVLRWLSSSLEAWEARFGWDLTLVVESDEFPETTLVPHVTPFPTRKMFVSTEVSRPCAADLHSGITWN